MFINTESLTGTWVVDVDMGIVGKCLADIS